MSLDSSVVLDILKTVASTYRGPGGAAAVLKDGKLVTQHTWGYADMNRRIPTTAEVLFPICSITKQFVSALLFDLTENLPSSVSGNASFQEQLIASLREVLPADFVDKAEMTVENLIDMRSGLRDYWALCTLQGSRPETVYSIQEHNNDMLRRIKSLQFQPGTEYSYSNTNFNVVERLIERVTNNSLQHLLRERIFNPAGMSTARLNPRTDRLPAPIIGYEGSEDLGFFPADNFIEWSADAGMVASLADMIAYEQHFDSKYRDTQSRYREVVQHGNYKDGSPARYRYGLKHAKVGDKDTLGHGGGLRGFSLHRRYVPDQRLSVIVLFNHMSNAAGATDHIIKQILHIAEPHTSTVQPATDWFGSFLDKDTQLSVQVFAASQGKIKIAYSRKPEAVTLTDATHAESPDIQASISSDTIHVRRLDDNRVLSAKRLQKSPASSARKQVQGVYRCSEIESSFICEGDGDMLYALFDGCFGQGPPHLMTYLGDVENRQAWTFADHRAMDDTPPGNWTVVFNFDKDGAISNVTIGCWLARKLEYQKI